MVLALTWLWVVSNLTKSTGKAVNNQSGKTLSGTKLTLLVSGGIFGLTLGTSVWFYQQGLRALRTQVKAESAQLYAGGTQATKTPDDKTTPEDSHPGKPGPESAIPAVLKQVEDWALRSTVATAAGGAALLLSGVLGMVGLRRAWSRRLAKTAEGWEQTTQRLTETTAALEAHLTEKKRLEREYAELRGDLDRRVEERTANLTKTYQALEAELNSRKQAEKALSQQARELGRSKDVLELHVQARTQELQKLQRRYEHILNSAGEGIYGLDLQGRTTFVNPAAAKLTGWKVEELVGKLENEAFHKNPQGAESGNQTDFLSHNGEHLSDQVFFRKDGTTFAVEYVRTQILEKDKVVGAVVIFKDITERKRTEETLARKAAELARSNAELEQFAYVASHDLQEPLRKIQAFGDRLKSKCDAAQLQDGRDYLERMQSAAARMQTLINDLLTFSRVISATQPFVPVDLAALTREVLTDLEVRIEQTKGKVEVGELPTIEADPLQMRQLLQNLVGNALKFQPPSAQPLIKIQAQTIKRLFAGGPDSTPDDEVVELTVQDNGIGFEEKYLDKIFAMFQRLHGRSEYEGTGVGLAVCRRITDRHGGTITARSKPGEGATFVVTLPMHRQVKELKAAA